MTPNKQLPQSPAGRAPDPRKERTRTAIVTGLSTLLRQGHSESTVRDVVTEAGVSRAAFYTHFSGVDEVALVVLREIFDELREIHLSERRELGQRTAASVRAGQERLADAFWQQRDLLRPLLEGSHSATAYMAIVRAFATTIESIMCTELPRIPAGIDARLASIAVANTLVGLLVAWVTGHIDVDLKTIVDHLVAMLPAWMSEPDLPTAH